MIMEEANEKLEYQLTGDHQKTGPGADQRNDDGYIELEKI